MACSLMTQAPYMQGNNLSAEAAVFVPSWKEFVPASQQIAAPAPSSGNCCCIDLDAYTDDSDESDEESTFCAPKPIEAPTPTEAEDSMRSRRPWRVSAPEFVPRGLASPDNATLANLEVEEPFPEKLANNEATVGAQAPVWRRGRGSAAEPDVSVELPETPTECDVVSAGKSPPWRRSISGTPKTNSSLSTICDSSETISPAGSVDDASTDSTASSCASRSRSPTPPPAVQEQAGLFTLRALLLWNTTSSEQPEELLPTAAKPEAGTPEAVIANRAQKEAEAGARSGNAPGSPNNSAQSWRRQSNAEDGSHHDRAWRDTSAAKKLDVSDDSWVARQAARRRTKSKGDVSGTESLSDEDIVRTVKSILNKLTVEKFESLSVQLLHCGIRGPLHLEILIQEVFEKATTQHHFIDMYADLCDMLNIHYSENCMNEDPKKNFKKVLLHSCQASFEKNLTPPTGLSELNHEDRTAAERLYKMRMLGNIRFVGALLVRKMLASKVMLAIMEELLQAPTPEALESLAALLTVVGPTFDTPDWAYRMTLNAIFSQIEKLIKKGSIDKRVSCILKDVLDLRNGGWQDRRPKKIEGPLKLNEVAAKAAQETGGWMQKAPSYSQNDWHAASQERQERLGKLCSLLPGKSMSPPSSPMSKVQQAPVQPKTPETTTPEKTTKGTGAGAAMLAFLKNRDSVPEQRQEEEVVTKPFNREACKTEIAATLAELRVSHDVPEAIARIVNIGVPVSDQASELQNVLSVSAEEGTQEARKVGFALAAGLMLGGHWTKQAATEGTRTFMQDVCPELKFDVPTLSRILREELHPAFSPLLEAGLLEAAQHESMMSF